MSDGYLLPCGAMAGDCSASIPTACEGCGNNPTLDQAEFQGEHDRERRFWQAE
jgi:hypothetical protein